MRHFELRVIAASREQLGQSLTLVDWDVDIWKTAEPPVGLGS